MSMSRAISEIIGISGYAQVVCQRWGPDATEGAASRHRGPPFWRADILGEQRGFIHLSVIDDLTQNEGVAADHDR